MNLLVMACLIQSSCLVSEGQEHSRFVCTSIDSVGMTVVKQTKKIKSADEFDEAKS